MRSRDRSRRLSIGLISVVLLLVLPVVPAHVAETPEHYQRALGKLTSTLQWDWVNSVPLHEQSRSQFQNYVRRSLHRMYSDNQRQALQSSYYLLGFVDSHFSLEKHMLNLYRDQAGAYYDPERGAIVELEGSLPASGRYFLYLHEGVHAYQDQRYDLKTMQENVQRSGSLDRSLAFSFAIEGHANLVATAALMNQSVADSGFYTSSRIQQFMVLLEQLGRWDPARLSMLEGMLGQSSGPLARMLKQLQNTPPILVHQLMDPYFVGQKIWYRRGREMGWEGAERWFRDMPMNTVSVLYGSNPEPGGGWVVPPDRIRSGTSTSLGSYILLRWVGRFMERPSWGGGLASDRVDLIGASGDRALIWQLRFATGQDCRAFQASLNRELSSGGTESGLWRRNGSRRYVRLESLDSSVLIVIDDDPDPTPELTSAGLADLFGDAAAESTTGP